MYGTQLDRNSYHDLNFGFYAVEKLELHMKKLFRNVKRINFNVQLSMIYR